MTFGMPKIIHSSAGGL